MLKMRKDNLQISGLRKLVETVSKRTTEKQTVVEIGSFAGESTAIIAPYVHHITAVDPWSQYYEPGSPIGTSEVMAWAEQEFDRRCASFGNISKLKMSSLEAAELFEDGSIDWVYIDGDHHYRAVLKDIEAWLPKCRIAIAGHDYSQERVRSAVVEKLGKIDHKFQDSSWLKWVS